MGLKEKELYASTEKTHSDKLIHSSESHRGKEFKLDNALCIITKPLRATQYKKK